MTRRLSDFMDDLFGDRITDPVKKKRLPIITRKRKAILDFLRGNAEMTLEQAVEMIGGDIYHNSNFHVGNLLNAMVKVGMIQRVKRGVFRL